MKTLTRKTRPAAKPVTLLALQEQEAWLAELEARKAARPLPLEPHWAAQVTRWGA